MRVLSGEHFDAFKWTRNIFIQINFFGQTLFVDYIVTPVGGNDYFLCAMGESFNSFIWQTYREAHKLSSIILVSPVSLQSVSIHERGA